jgi:hypothetical protein
MQNRACSECGLPFFRWQGELRPQEFCRRGHPARGPQVFPGVPRWLAGRLNEHFPNEVRIWHGRKLQNKREAESFVLNALTEYAPIWDHQGHTGQVLIAEPYAVANDLFVRLVGDFASRLKVDHAIGRTPSWHAPWFNECLRIEFFLPGVRP